MERARAVGPRAASRSMHGPDEAGPGVRVLSGLSAGAGQLSEAGPVRVVKVEQPGGPEHRRRKPTIGGPGGPTRRVSKARCVIERRTTKTVATSEVSHGGAIGGVGSALLVLVPARRPWYKKRRGGRGGEGPGCFRIHAHAQDRAW